MPRGAWRADHLPRTGTLVVKVAEGVYGPPAFNERRAAAIRLARKRSPKATTGPLWPPGAFCKRRTNTARNPRRQRLHSTPPIPALARLAYVRGGSCFCGQSPRCPGAASIGRLSLPVSWSPHITWPPCKRRPSCAARTLPSRLRASLIRRSQRGRRLPRQSFENLYREKGYLARKMIRRSPQWG